MTVETSKSHTRICMCLSDQMIHEHKNLRRAFQKYDRKRTGRITIDDFRYILQVRFA